MVQFQGNAKSVLWHYQVQLGITLRVNWLRRGVTAAIFLASLLLLVVPHSVAAIEFADHFDDMSHWAFYRGQESANEMIDTTPTTEPGPTPPSLKLPPARSLQPDPPGFGDDVVSIYLSNPDTSKLANFTLDFWIHFDDNEGRAGRAIVTFRMQDDRHYYAAYLSDDVSWTSRIDKFVDDKEITLKQTEKGGAFDPSAWSHVKLEVQGPTFNLYKDDSLILTASDNTWPSGKAYGIGIYNGYNTHSFHVDDLLLETCEPLCYVSMVTATITIKQTTSASTTETSTELSTVLSTTTTTGTSRITQYELVTKTSFITSPVSVLVPVLDWGSFTLLLMVGIIFGYVGDIRKYRPMYEVVAVVLVLIVGTYYVVARELSSLGALVAGVAIGVCARLVWKVNSPTTSHKEKSDDPPEEA